MSEETTLSCTRERGCAIAGCSRRCILDVASDFSTIMKKAAGDLRAYQTHIPLMFTLLDPSNK